MPELPEVEVVRRGLAPAVTGAIVERVEVHDERALTRHLPGAADFAARLEGARLAAPRRRGKFLWIPIEGGREALIGHLGMSGQLLLRERNAADDRHLRIRLGLDGPAGPLDVAFVDQRTFGSLAVDALRPSPDAPEDAAQRIPGQVAHIARDPMDPRFDEPAALARLARSRAPIKAALLDQTLVSGIGNIYADESLWAARLHPMQPAGTISTRKARELFAAVRRVLEKALGEGGTSFDAQYVNVNGQAGYFAHSLHAYGRTGEPCDRCGTPIRRAPFASRSSHFCPRCQRLRR